MRVSRDPIVQESYSCYVARKDDRWVWVARYNTVWKMGMGTVAWDVIGEGTTRFRSRAIRKAEDACKGHRMKMVATEESRSTTHVWTPRF